MQDAPRSVLRAFDLLEVLARHADGLTLTELARSIDAPISTTQQLVRSLLVRQLAIQKPASKRYYMGPAAYGLAERIMQGSSITSAARPYLEDLAGRTGEDVYLGVSTGDHVTYVDKVEGVQSIRLAIALGVPRSLHASAAGKVFLAARATADLRHYIDHVGLTRYTPSTAAEEPQLLEQLERIRVSGVSISDGESIEGVMAIAAPIFRADEIVAVICISGPRQRLLGQQDQLTELVRRTADHIEKDLHTDQEKL